MYKTNVSNLSRTGYPSRLLDRRKHLCLKHKNNFTQCTTFWNRITALVIECICQPTNIITKHILHAINTLNTVTLTSVTTDGLMSVSNPKKTEVINTTSLLKSVNQYTMDG